MARHLHGRLYDGGHFWIAQNQTYKDKVNLKFTDENQISSLMSSKDCVEMAAALLEVALTLDGLNVKNIK